MTNGYFIEPTLALCTDRSRLAQENSVIGGPDNWLTDNVLNQFGAIGVGFDFFINWNTTGLDRNIWIKRPINTGLIKSIDSMPDDQIAEILRADSKFTNLVRFSSANNLTTSAIIFDDSQNWHAESASAIHAFWPRDATLRHGLVIDRIRRSDIETLIREKSGGPVNIGSKGLIYGTSCLECTLSTTDALWPGDADLVVCEKNGLKPLAILEFKKHTSKSTLTFDQQGLGNYYPYPDGRKYNRLALLSEQLAQHQRVPLFVVYYSVLPNEFSVVVEPVLGFCKQLTGGTKVRIQLDPSNLVASSVAVASCILDVAKNGTNE